MSDEFFDPAELRNRLTALARQHGQNAGELRRRVLDLLKRLVADAHTRAEAELFEHGHGTRCARALSHFHDELLRAIYDFTITHVYRSPNPTEGERIAVVAVGGYGRGTLAPYSDIDLLFLHPHKLTPWAESVIEYLLYLLWDLGFKVGHATRHVDHCITLARSDHTIRTSILEARFLWGDRELFNTLTRRFDSEIVARTIDDFIETKLEERDRRHRRAGESRYLVEPNVKEGKGGLRDLHTLFWLGRYVYRTSRRADLVDAGLLTRQEYARFEKAEDFLWAVRCHLHFEMGRAEDRLTFDLQPEIARRLGYSERPGQRHVERFMKHYFLVAKDVGDLTRIVCAALEERQIKSAPVFSRVLGTFGFRPTRALDHGFTIGRGRLNLQSASVFRDDPVNLIRLFHFADTEGALLHPDLVQRASRSLGLIDDALREDPEANRVFLEILTSPRAPERTLRQMNEVGVLGRFVPDFGRIVAMTQFSRYHHFTVDEHLLRTVGFVSELEHGRLGDDHPLSHEIFPTLENRRILYVTAFLHDIAKGRPEDHSIAGAEVARRLCPRFGLSKSETATIAWLIEHHLVMSEVSQRRDLFDPKTISDFAELVQIPERLKLLLVLTVADIRAVGPGVWNGWKGELLRTLYYETEPVLAGGHTAGGRARRAEAARERFRKAMTAWSGEEIERHTSRLNDPYWLTTDLELQLAHARLIDGAEGNGTVFNAAHDTDAFRGVTRLIVYMPDHPHILATIAGACAMSHADIVDAQIVTTADGWVLDTVALRRDFDDADEDRRARRIARTIESSLRGELLLPAAVERRTRPQRVNDPFDVEPQIVISNSLSDHSTVIEIACLDRPGLLYDITRALRELSLNIRSAHIATFGERAVDVFYVRNLFGLRIHDGARLNQIRAALAAAIDPESAIENVVGAALGTTAPPAPARA
jgi:[protein-PII] uridylyltransferase